MCFLTGSNHETQSGKVSEFHCNNKDEESSKSATLSLVQAKLRAPQEMQNCMYTVWCTIELILAVP